MSKIKMLGAAFLAVLAFGAVSAAAASASEWLAGGAKITSALAATTKGTWTLVGHSFFGFVTTEVTCTGALLGTVGAGANDNVTEVEGPKGEKSSGASAIECKVSTSNPGACVAGGTAEVTPLHMPWPSKLVAGTTKPKDEFNGTGGAPGFTVSCKNGSETHTNSCEGKVLSDELENTRKGVAGKVLKVKSEKCSEAGSTAETSAEGETVLTNGLLLEAAN